MKTEKPKVLRLEGLSDLTTATSVRDQISDALHRHAVVVVDVPAEEDVGLSFLQTLVSARKSAVAMGKSISIYVPEDGIAGTKFTASAISDSVFPDRIEVAPETSELKHESAAPISAALQNNEPVAGLQMDVAETQAEDPSIDRNALAALVKELGAAAVDESLTVFFAELEDRIKLLEQLSLDGDLRVILREAHSLKGTAGTFGLRRLAEYGAELEREARNLDTAEYRKMLARMATMYEASRRMLPATSTLAA
jgi:HPt (histidine-containing phosphotransfer) domain-containing protein/anti-anti-sigma regulatory factor